MSGITASDIRRKFNLICGIEDRDEREKMMFATLGDVILWIEDRENQLRTLQASADTADLYNMKF